MDTYFSTYWCVFGAKMAYLGENGVYDQYGHADTYDQRSDLLKVLIYWI